MHACTGVRSRLLRIVVSLLPSIEGAMYVQRGYLQSKELLRKKVAQLVSPTCPPFRWVPRWYSGFQMQESEVS
jgi:hypothetical protein